jgi:ABC-type glycerol-3-phosphate transport system substrate-binding protein
MSVQAFDTQFEFFHFVAANQADRVTRDGQLMIDDPKIRRGLVEAIDSYTGIYRKGCTPPDAVNWSTDDRNNKAFLAQTVVATPNGSLSIPMRPSAATGRLPQQHGQHSVAARPWWRTLPDLGDSVVCRSFRGSRQRY